MSTVSNSTIAPKKKKILMLHGHAQSDKVFSSKTGGLRKTLNKLGYELYYPCAPTEIVPCDFPENLDIASTFNTTSGTNMYTWLLRDPITQYEQIPEITKDYLYNYILENGPFHGIIGFSQGSGYGGLLSTNINELLNLTELEQSPLNFFVNFSGYRMKTPELQKYYSNDILNIPSLHVLGELDSVVEESRVMSLYDACPEDKRTLLKHPGGHFVPNSKSFVTKVANWLQVVDGGISEQQKEIINKDETSTSNETSNKPMLDDDLLDIIDGLGKI
ncbi:putative serine hydrolase SCDLUD_000404 [Saccharomycodes ludwigii]|uniref:putative serine hydrolase n=1 Tax=Saccharomycodes ludwigii TaxID=36035 RepID=UPI001E8BC96E|nr:hypothetical protein SCDLUD_000404 [Saccharomycodes ludwigii]KAH3902813.1 hypothetical protein SCDLUD_000404 [Saccharomycodes ludwigii]